MYANRAEDRIGTSQLACELPSLPRIFSLYSRDTALPSANVPLDTLSEHGHAVFQLRNTRWSRTTRAGQPRECDQLLPSAASAPDALPDGDLSSLDLESYRANN